MGDLAKLLLEGLQVSAPIALAAVGAVFTEKGGVVNIGLEGTMLVSAFFIVWGSIVGGSIFVGLLLAIIAGVVVAAIHAVATVTFRVNQIVSGVAINLLALGIGEYLSRWLFGQAKHTPANPNLFPTIWGINSFTFAMIPIAFIAWFVLYKTVFGLRLRAVGENPAMAETLGVNVSRMRYYGVLLSGAFCGLAAGALYPAQWLSGMTGGRGFLALAAMIFGRWHPVGALCAAMLFGCADAFRIVFAARLPISSQVVQMFPYLLAVIVLSGLVGRAKPPAASGIPYTKEGKE